MAALHPDFDVRFEEDDEDGDGRGPKADHSQIILNTVTRGQLVGIASVLLGACIFIFVAASQAPPAYKSKVTPLISPKWVFNRSRILFPRTYEVEVQFSYA